MYADKDFRLHLKEMTQGFVIHTCQMFELFDEESIICFLNFSENHFLKSVKHLQFANNCRRQVGVFDEDRIARFGG